MLFTTGKFFKTFRGSNIWGYVFLCAMILLMIYYMKTRFRQISETVRTQKTQGSGLEFFTKRFLYLDSKGQKFNIDRFKNKAVIVNYFISGEEDTLKLYKSQSSMLRILGDQSDDIVVIYVKDDNYKDELKDLMPSMILVSDWNRSREIMPIKKYPYSLMFNKNHELVGKVDGYQDWSDGDKVEFVRKLYIN